MSWRTIFTLAGVVLSAAAAAFHFVDGSAGWAWLFVALSVLLVAELWRSSR
jgi:hypothetical protein